MTVPVSPASPLPGVGAWFTARDPAGGPPVGGAVADEPGLAAAVGRLQQPGNLAHRRPHVPALLARARAQACGAMGIDPAQLHLLEQVHGAAVARVTADTPAGAEARGADVLVTDRPGRALGVQVADCVPLLLASTAGPVAAVHAGRQGLLAGVVDAALAALEDLDVPARTLHAVLGPAIGGCCYEVPRDLQREVLGRHPAAEATTTWDTPALDLPAAVRARLDGVGVAEVRGPPGCTHCDPAGRWFSHRRDPAAGRQLGVVVRREEVAA